MKKPNEKHDFPDDTSEEAFKYYMDEFIEPDDLDDVLDDINVWDNDE